MSSVFSSPLFGIVLCIFSFEIGLWINRKTHSPLANPLLIAICICIIFLQVFSVPLEDFQQRRTDHFHRFWLRRLPPWQFLYTVIGKC